MQTGLVVSREADSMASLLSKQTMQKMKAAPLPTWNTSWAMYVSLSHSNRPLVVYWKTEEVMLSIRLDTRCFRASSGSAFRTAFWKTTLNAWGRTGATGADTTPTHYLRWNTVKHCRHAVGQYFCLGWLFKMKSISHLPAVIRTVIVKILIDMGLKCWVPRCNACLGFILGVLCNLSILKGFKNIKSLLLYLPLMWSVSINTNAEGVLFKWAANNECIFVTFERISLDLTCELS